MDNNLQIKNEQLSNSTYKRIENDSIK